MNQRQRYFADVARLMTRGRAAGEHGPARFNNGGPGGAGGGAAGGEGGNPPLAKLEPVEFNGHSYDLNKKIVLRDDHVEQDLTGYLEAIRYHARLALATRGADEKEVFAKVQADIDNLLEEQRAVLKDYREHLRNIPEPDDRKLKATAFEYVRLRYDPQAEAKARTDKESASGNSYLSRMSAAHFNVLVQTPAELGVDDERAVKKLNRFKALHDALALASIQTARRDPSTFSQNGGWRMFREAAEYEALALELGQAIRLGNAINETNADEGKNWVPGPILSSRIYPKIEEELRLVAAFETINMTAKQQDSGVLGAHKSSYKLLENIADDGSTAGAKITPSLWVTKKWSLDAKLHAAGALATPNWLQDAIAGSADILADLVYALEYGRENWLINGQLSGAIDTGAAAPSTYDIRNMGDGLRKWYQAIKTASGLTDVDFSAGIAADKLPNLFGQQGSYGMRPRRSIWICNTFCMAQLLVMKTSTGRDVVLTYGQAGDRATFRTGSLAQMFDRDIVVTQCLSQTMDVSGIDTGVGDRSVLLHVFTDAVKHGVRLGTQVDMSSDARFFEYQEAFRAVARDDFGWVYDPAVAGNAFVSQAVGIKKIS